MSVLLKSVTELLLFHLLTSGIFHYLLLLRMCAATSW